MSYAAEAIANWFLDRADRDGTSLGPMKLQKLIYFAHGWWLALYNTPLIEEHPEAWDFGPVIPSIYHEFKVFGRDAITARATRFETKPKMDSSFLLSAKIITPHVNEDDKAANDFLNRIWQVYKDFTGFQLSNMTHAPGSAWHRVFEQSEGRKGVDIPDELIRAEFLQKMQAQPNGTATQ